MCALEIEQRTAAEPQFPALRGTVHWGDLVYQEGGYVGGSLNVASRVAAQTTPHQIVVSRRPERGRVGRWRGAGTPRAGFAPEALDIAVERFDWQKWLERDSSGSRSTCCSSPTSSGGGATMSV
jgi:class 3 adenylate cyclase